MAQELELAELAVEPVSPPPVSPGNRWLEPIVLPELDYSRVAEVLVARGDFGGRGSVLLLGDLDTSYPAGSIDRFPFRVEDGQAVGPGVADMKGGLVVLSAALRALRDARLRAPAVSVVLSPDEQAGSLRSRQVIETEASGRDCCLCVECAREGGNLMGSRSQCGVALIEVRGREAHAGSAYASGVSAIEALARKVPDINALTDPSRGLFVSVGLVRGGRRRSVVPGLCTAVVDVRAADAAGWETLETALHGIAAREDLPGSVGSLSIHAHRPAVPWTSGTDGLIRVARKAGEALGIQFGVVRSGAGGSSAFAGPLGVPVLDGMGPAGGGLMTDNEHVDVRSLAERAALLALTLHLLGGAERT
jgi:glutamate carboxypeptidase